jgi:multiple sugar transport system permease protein
VLAGEAYFWYNAYQNPGVAAAYAVLILGISVLATLVYLRLMRPKREVAA